MSPSSNYWRLDQLKIGNLHIKSSLCQNLFGIICDYKLNFAEHIEDIFQKSSRNENALARLAPYMTLSKNLL